MSRLMMSLVILVIAACGGNAVRSTPSPSPDPDPAPDADPPRAVVIAVTVRGIAGTEGTIRMALFASDDGFPGERDRAVQSGAWPIDADTLEALFDDVPPGRYAVSVIHDENDDGKMATDFMGRPKEGYGFSRDARGRFGPPGFDSAAFDATGDTTRVEIHLQY